MHYRIFLALFRISIGKVGGTNELVVKRSSLTDWTFVFKSEKILSFSFNQSMAEFWNIDRLDLWKGLAV